MDGAVDVRNRCWKMGVESCIHNSDSQLDLVLDYAEDHKQGNTGVTSVAIIIG